MIWLQYSFCRLKFWYLQREQPQWYLLYLIWMRWQKWNIKRFMCRWVSIYNWQHNNLSFVRYFRLLFMAMKWSSFEYFFLIIGLAYVASSYWMTLIQKLFPKIIPIFKIPVTRQFMHPQQPWHIQSINATLVSPRF